jgi:hypothetical protein
VRARSLRGLALFCRLLRLSAPYEDCLSLASRVVVVNAPAIFPLAFAVVKPALPKHSVAKVRKMPRWPRGWANFNLFVAVFPQECVGLFGPFGPA